MADDRPDVKCICRALPGERHKQGCKLREPDDHWLVPKQEYFGTEIKLSHEFMTGMLRAAGGTLTWSDGDMLRTLNSRIEMMRYQDPNRYVIRLVEEPEPPKELPPRRAGTGMTWIDPATGLMWRYHRDKDHDGWYRLTPPDNEPVWWTGGWRE